MDATRTRIEIGFKILESISLNKGDLRGYIVIQSCIKVTTTCSPASTIEEHIHESAVKQLEESAKVLPAKVNDHELVEKGRYTYTFHDTFDL